MTFISPTDAAWPDWLIAELRSDHAGETGAVAIYGGILAISRNPQLRSFAARHRETERLHLALMDQLLVPARRSVLLPAWRVAGWLTGAIPALFGTKAVYATIAAVEQFVDEHYQQQIVRLAAEHRLPTIQRLLEDCRQDECHHRDEAAAEAGERRSALLSLWCRLVDWGSRAAVVAARRA